MLDALESLLPHAARHQVHAGHMAPLTHPSLVNPLIARFIAEGEDDFIELRAEALLEPA